MGRMLTGKTGLRLDKVAEDDDYVLCCPGMCGCDACLGALDTLATLWAVLARVGGTLESLQDDD